LEHGYWLARKNRVFMLKKCTIRCHLIYLAVHLPRSKAVTNLVLQTIIAKLSHLQSLRLSGCLLLTDNGFSGWVIFDNIKTVLTQTAGFA
jgi:hypothetical protein